MEDNVCLLFCKHVDVSRFEVYHVINSILNNNINNCFDKYGAEFQKHFEEKLTVLRMNLIDKYFFTLGVNKRVVSNQQGSLKTDPSKTSIYSYVVQPKEVTVCR